jgi:hypothetical protein
MREKIIAALISKGFTLDGKTWNPVVARSLETHKNRQSVQGFADALAADLVSIFGDDVLINRVGEHVFAVVMQVGPNISFHAKGADTAFYKTPRDAVERLYLWCRAWLGYDPIEVRQSAPVVISLDPAAFDGPAAAADFVLQFKKHLGGN